MKLICCNNNKYKDVLTIGKYYEDEKGLTTYDPYTLQPDHTGYYIIICDDNKHRKWVLTSL